MTSEMQSIADFLEKNDLGFVGHIPLYPKDGKHIEINISDFNLSIKKGLDTFYYQKNTESKSHLWYVFHGKRLLIDKGFRSYDKAIKEAIKYRLDFHQNAVTKLVEYKQKLKAI